MFPELVQLGVAGTIAIVLVGILKLLIDGKLHTDSEIAVRDLRTAELLEQVKTLTIALTSSNDQAKAIISLWKALQSSDEED